MKTSRIYFLTALALIPSIAFANAGTPLIWLQMIHLVIGNLLIGIGEGLIIAKLTKAGKIRSILIMILANYASAAVGAAMLYFQNEITSENYHFFIFEHIRLSIAIALIFFVVITLIVEMPFFYWIVRGERAQLNKSVRALLVANVISYATLAPLYYLSSVANTDFKVGETNGIQQKGYILYVSADGKEVRKISLSNFKENVTVEQINLGRDQDTQGFLEEFANKNFSDYNRKHHQNRHGEPDNGTLWKTDRIGTWAIEGMQFSLRSDKSLTLNIAVESPPFMWDARCASMFESDEIIAGLGPYIVHMNLRDKTITPIALGRCPTVILESNNRETQG